MRPLLHQFQISVGHGGRCCHLALSYWNRSEGLVPEFSLEFCATGADVVQLRHGMAMGLAEGIRADPIRSEEIGVMVDELIGGEVEDCGVDVA